MKGRLPRFIFLAKALKLYQKYKNPNEKELLFSNQWMKGWMIEFNVSLLHPNKRFSIKLKDLIERLLDLIKNMLMVRKYCVEQSGVEPVIVNGDQVRIYVPKC